MKPTEVVARAILDDLGVEYGSVLPTDVGLAISAALDAAGYAIVPKKPTPAMIEAGNQHVDWRMSEDIYTAMVEAAAKTEPST